MPPVPVGWRESLKVGDKIDVLKEERVDTERVEGWTRATIREIVGEVVFCTFDGMDQERKEPFNRNGPRIAPVGTRTEGWDWKDKIVPEDRVDIFDTQGKWFLGTVLETSIDINGVKLLYIGFRVYLPTGTKLDNHGRRHEGWSPQYDTWIPAYSIRIQRFTFCGLL